MAVKCMIKIVECSTDDAETLADMNRMLIEDEKAETALSPAQLQERMAGFLQSEYQACMFSANGKVVGYALCNIQRAPIYLRQFFICREERRKGYGKQAFQALLDHLNSKEIDIDVYVWNNAGVAFWESLGFCKRCYNMRYSQ
jgi:ribosomal protein S18 acetylase RimI-like enzyme